MTKLLEQAVAQIRQLPEDQQDALAANLMNLIDDTLTADEQRELIESDQAYGRQGGAPRPPAKPASRRTLDPGFFDDGAPPLDL
jgi:hypothetical protein